MVAAVLVTLEEDFSYLFVLGSWEWELRVRLM
jgi:hypothetical protein